MKVSHFFLVFIGISAFINLTLASDDEVTPRSTYKGVEIISPNYDWTTSSLKDATPYIIALDPFGRDFDCADPTILDVYKNYARHLGELFKVTTGEQSLRFEFVDEVRPVYGSFVFPFDVVYCKQSVQLSVDRFGDLAADEQEERPVTPFLPRIYDIDTSSTYTNFFKDVDTLGVDASQCFSGGSTVGVAVRDEAVELRLSRAETKDSHISYTFTLSTPLGAVPGTFAPKPLQVKAVDGTLVDLEWLVTSDNDGVDDQTTATYVPLSVDRGVWNGHITAARLVLPDTMAVHPGLVTPLLSSDDARFDNVRVVMDPVSASSSFVSTWGSLEAAYLTTTTFAARTPSTYVAWGRTGVDETLTLAVANADTGDELAPGEFFAAHYLVLPLLGGAVEAELFTADDSDTQLAIPAESIWFYRVTSTTPGYSNLELRLRRGDGDFTTVDLSSVANTDVRAVEVDLGNISAGRPLSAINYRMSDATTCSAVRNFAAESAPVSEIRAPVSAMADSAAMARLMSTMDISTAAPAVAALEDPAPEPATADIGMTELELLDLYFGIDIANQEEITVDRDSSWFQNGLLLESRTEALPAEALAATPAELNACWMHGDAEEPINLAFTTVSSGFDSWQTRLTTTDAGRLVFAGNKLAHSVALTNGVHHNVAAAPASERRSHAKIFPWASLRFVFTDAYTDVSAPARVDGSEDIYWPAPRGARVHVTRTSADPLTIGVFDADRPFPNHEMAQVEVFETRRLSMLALPHSWYSPEAAWIKYDDSADWTIPAMPYGLRTGDAAVRAELSVSSSLPLYDSVVALIIPLVVSDLVVNTTLVSSEITMGSTYPPAIAPDSKLDLDVHLNSPSSITAWPSYHIFSRFHHRALPMELMVNNGPAAPSDVLWAPMPRTAEIAEGDEDTDLSDMAYPLRDVSAIENFPLSETTPSQPSGLMSAVLSLGVTFSWTWAGEYTYFASSFVPLRDVHDVVLAFDAAGGAVTEVASGTAYTLTITMPDTNVETVTWSLGANVYSSDEADAERRAAPYRVLPTGNVAAAAEENFVYVADDVVFDAKRNLPTAISVSTAANDTDTVSGTFDITFNTYPDRTVKFVEFCARSSSTDPVFDGLLVCAKDASEATKYAYKPVADLTLDRVVQPQVSDEQRLALVRTTAVNGRPSSTPPLNGGDVGVVPVLDEIPGGSYSSMAGLVADYNALAVAAAAADRPIDAQRLALTRDLLCNVFYVNNPCTGSGEDACADAPEAPAGCPARDALPADVQMESGLVHFSDLLVPVELGDLIPGSSDAVHGLPLFDDARTVLALAAAATGVDEAAVSLSVTAAATRAISPTSGYPAAVYATEAPAHPALCMASHLLDAEKDAGYSTFVRAPANNFAAGITANGDAANVFVECSAVMPVAEAQADPVVAAPQVVVVSVTPSHAAEKIKSFSFLLLPTVDTVSVELDLGDSDTPAVSMLVSPALGVDIVAAAAGSVVPDADREFRVGDHFKVKYRAYGRPHQVSRCDLVLASDGDLVYDDAVARARRSLGFEIELEVPAAEQADTKDDALLSVNSKAYVVTGDGPAANEGVVCNDDVCTVRTDAFMIEPHTWYTPKEIGVEITRTARTAQTAAPFKFTVVPAAVGEDLAGLNGLPAVCDVCGPFDAKVDCLAAAADGVLTIGQIYTQEAGLSRTGAWQKTLSVAATTVEPSGLDSNIVTAIGVVVGVLVLVVGGFVFWFIRHQAHAKRQRRGIAEMDALQFDESLLPLVEKLKKLAIPRDEVVIGRQIGVGGFGVVSVANWVGTQVCVKQLHPHLVGNTANVESFIAEAVTMSSLRHPNVVAFLGAIAHPPAVWLVTELCARGSLTKYIRQNPRPSLSNRLKLAHGAALGLRYLHAREMVHRDIKADNILIDASYQAKIADLGLTRLVDRSATMTAVGTPAWFAPELFLNSDHAHYTEKIDVYSFGIMLWEVLTGEAPFANVAPMKVPHRVAVHGERPPIPPDSDAEFVELIKHCWDADPAVRPSMNEVAERLRAIVERLTGSDDMSIVDDGLFEAEIGMDEEKEDKPAKKSRRRRKKGDKRGLFGAKQAPAAAATATEMV